MHTYSFFNILVIFELLGTFLIVFHSLLLFLFTLVVSMAPKRKSTSTWNPLHSGASSPSDSAPLSLRFRNDNAHKAFSKNFSRRGVHSERQVILANFTDTNLPTVIHSREWESLCDILVTCPLILFRSSTLTCTGLIVQYLSSLLTFEVRALRMCFGFLRLSFLTILVVSVCGLCPRMSLWLLFASTFLIRVIVSLHHVGLLLKVLDSLTW